jgi:acetylornithine deacetylase/succinyl-diaminopimelate desuccinylase-like protein
MFGGASNGTAHARDEYAEVPDILETAAELAAFMIDWCGPAERE